MVIETLIPLISHDDDKGSCYRVIETPYLHNGLGVAAGGEHLPPISSSEAGWAVH